jgi:hypothetical protein
MIEPSSLVMLCLIKFKLTHKIWLEGHSHQFHQTFLWNVYILDCFSTDQTSRMGRKSKKAFRRNAWSVEIGKKNLFVP